MRDENSSRELHGSPLNEKTGISVPSIIVPKGGGAISGIGEKFAANPLTGTGSMTVPISTSPGRSGFGPQLSLSYDFGAGNGAFGFGWNLSIPSITRRTDRGLPKYSDSEETDIFVLSGAEDLVRFLLKKGGRATFDSPQASPVFWSGATGPGSRVYLRASSDGRTKLPPSAIGALSQRKISQRSTAIATMPESLTRPIQPASSHGSFVRAATIRAMPSSIHTNPRTAPA